MEPELQPRPAERDAQCGEASDEQQQESGHIIKCGHHRLHWVRGRLRSGRCGESSRQFHGKPNYGRKDQEQDCGCRKRQRQRTHRARMRRSLMPSFPAGSSNCSEKRTSPPQAEIPFAASRKPVCPAGLQGRPPRNSLRPGREDAGKTGCPAPKAGLPRGRPGGHHGRRRQHLKEGWLLTTRVTLETPIEALTREQKPGRCPGPLATGWHTGGNSTRRSALTSWRGGSGSTGCCFTPPADAALGPEVLQPAAGTTALGRGGPGAAPAGGERRCTESVLRGAEEIRSRLLEGLPISEEADFPALPYGGEGP